MGLGSVYLGTQMGMPEIARRERSEERHRHVGKFRHSPGMYFKFGVATKTAAREALLANTSSIRSGERLAASGRFRATQARFVCADVIN